ncbi:MAG TPA: hypothetical protein VLL48_13355 [Longimicrobiales bacterium]|nr:hypothetical protein [Longimicrobiales bacterium]
MPSDALLDDVMEALRKPREAHRSAVVASVEELRGVLAGLGNGNGGRASRLGRELGPFAEGRIDARALAAVLSVEERTLAPGSMEVLERALAVLGEAADGLDEDSVVRVPPGGDLRDAVKDALHGLGVVFGVAGAAELARNGAYRPDGHNALFSGKPFHRWTPAERRVAPPLVVIVDGTDLRPAGLADFLDGAVKIVLLVEGKAPPASLSRVVTPGITVIQSRDPADVARAVEAEGPALVAVFEAEAEGPVEFVHDPGAGTRSWERLTVDADLDELQARLDGTPWHRRGQAEDLAHLLALAREPVGAAGPPPTDPAVVDEPSAGVDQLAAWLLASTEL